MADSPDLRRYRANLQGEVDSASLYLTLAEAEKDPKVAEVYRKLAATEKRHADFWAKEMAAKGSVAGAVAPSLRARLLSWLVRRFGASAVLPTIMAAEARDRSAYSTQPEAEAAGIAVDERGHMRVVKSAMAASGGLAGPEIARLEGRHRAGAGNALRAAVLGANDGLVSNLSLVMGVAGAAAAEQTILLAGLAGLVAGACSMAMGEWLSVNSSRELYLNQIALEAAELESNPAEEREELILIYQAKGLSEVQATEIADRLLSDKATAVDTLAREELGIDPEELGGSAWIAAISSFFLFACGAIFPVAPFFLLGAMPRSSRASP